MTLSTAEDDIDLAPPRKEDKLFVGDQPDWKNNACVNIGQGRSFPYIHGYLYAARLLADEVVDTNRNQDYLIYPIVFLYRHHIELQLKDIIKGSFALLDRLPTEDINKHLGEHKLLPLWKDAEHVLAEILKDVGWGALAPETLDGISSYVNQLMEIDGDSFGFRYPTTKKGTPSLPSKLHRINIRHFSETIERLTDFLVFISEGLDSLQEQKGYGHHICG